MSKGRRDDRLRRRAPSRERKKRILVVTEGKVTEPEYLKAFAHQRRNPLVHVEIVGPAGVPITVVREAVAVRQKARDEATRERDDNLRFDVAWAVFDRDEHPTFAEALKEAKASLVDVAPSNPSFELWALLHFEDQTGSIERHHVRERLEAHLPRYDKQLDYPKLAGQYAVALTRAQALATAANRVGDPQGNPTTAVWALTELISKHD